MPTSKTFSQAFISRASVHVMSFLAALLSSNTVAASHIRRFVTHRHCMYVNMHVYVCTCVCSGEGSSGSRWPGRLLYYFWEDRPFPLEGLIEENWLSPSPPLRLRESGQAQLSRLAGCSSSAKPAGLVACTRPSTHSTTLHTDGWTAYWTSLSLVPSKWIKGIPPPLSENRHLEAVLRSCIHVSTAKSVLWVL